MSEGDHRTMDRGGARRSGTPPGQYVCAATAAGHIQIVFGVVGWPGFTVVREDPPCTLVWFMNGLRSQR